MTTYLWLKLVHIVSATILFGTGLGTAFFMLRAYLAGSDETLAATTRSVVLADWLFTTPAVVIQLLTGVWLMRTLNMPFDSTWFVVVIGLYVFVGICWVPVVWIQVRMRDLIASGAAKSELRPLMRAWILLGIPAFASVLLLFFLMVSKAGAYG